MYHRTHACMHSSNDVSALCSLLLTLSPSLIIISRDIHSALFDFIISATLPAFNTSNSNKLYDEKEDARPTQFSAI